MKVKLLSILATAIFAAAVPFPLEAQKGYIVVAHRGGANIGNENTLSCMAAGIAAGADMIETDIHLSRDGQMIVCHDPKIDRTTDGKGKIEEMAAEEIRSFHVIDSESGEVTDEVLPTLDEVMELISGECSLLLEIKRKKDQYQGIEEKVVEIIRRYHAESWVTVQSFNDSVIERIHAIAPDIRLQKLIVTRLPFRLAFDGTVTRFNYDKYDYVEAINTNVHFASKSMIRKAHAAGKLVGVWTINERKQVERMLEAENPDERVDIIITNSPEKFQ